MTDGAGPKAPTLVVQIAAGGPGEWPNWPNANQVTINGMGNWPHIANPAGAADAVNAFLEELAEIDLGASRQMSPRP